MSPDAEAIARSLDEIGRLRRAAHGPRGGPRGDRGFHDREHTGDHEWRGRGHGHGRPERGEWHGPRGGPRRHLGVHRLLQALADASHPLSITELGEAIGVDQPRASRLVRELQDAGLVRREPDPSDARRSIVVLTQAGRQRTAEHLERRASSIQSALESLDPREREQLAALLKKLAAGWPRG